MGSSKKSGEKDRESSDDERRSRKRRGKERSRGHHGRSRSRSRDKERGRSTSRDRRGTRDYREKRRRRRQSSEDESTSSKHTRSEGRGKNGEGAKEVKVEGGGDALSLSVDETNKLRAKLGLKPLNVGNTENEESKQEEQATKKKEDVHVPAKNIGELKMAEKLKQKMETMRESRQLSKKLASITSLGASEHQQETAVEWVERQKRREHDREEAKRRARLLEEMEEEFGVTELLDQTLQDDKAKAYTSGHLSGLKVEHDHEAFREGRDTILTLKDSSILDDEGDVLVNINIVDDEHAKKNVELKKGKPAYNPYEGIDDEESFGLEVKAPAILKKYDEEIEGVKRSSFMLGEMGQVDTSEERERALIRERLKAKGLTLQTAPSVVVSEYYTAEEMVQFKKPRKKKKIRKRLKADDLVPLGDDVPRGGKDHGSRRPQEPAVEELMDTEFSELKDEDDTELNSALVRTRRLLTSSSGSSGAAKVVGMLQSVPRGEQQTMEGVIVLDKTAEFCHQVGGGSEDTTPPRRSVSSFHGDHGEEDEMEEEQPPPAEEEHGGWMEVQPDTQEEQSVQEDDLYQEAEPDVAKGLAAAVRMATKKGFLDTTKQRRDASELLMVESGAQPDREYVRQKERERERELSRFDRDSSFPEKKGYTPNVHIEYVDDSGRVLGTKEAFRFMSHKFHGRASGKKKTEKRLKKIKDEHFMSRASSIDTPLNTLSMLQSKQQQSHSPYIVLSGGAHSMLAPANIIKKK